MKYKFRDVLGMPLSIEIFRRSNIVRINTPFMCPIVLFQWDIKFLHDTSNHWSELSNICLCSIFPWRMELCGGLLNTVSSAVVGPFPPQYTFWVVYSCHWWNSILPWVIFQGSPILTFLLQGSIHSTYLIQFPWIIVNKYYYEIIYL